MPKIIDHEMQKIRIAENAIGIFRKRGYSAVSFRQIARELGMSKSGLYHYFSGKKELFSFCGTIFLNRLIPEIASTDVQQNGQQKSKQDQQNVLMEIARRLEPDFLAEIRLLLDYIHCFQDRTELRQFLDLLQKEISPIVPESLFPAALRLILGDLFIKNLTDMKDDWTVLGNVLERLYTTE